MRYGLVVSGLVLCVAVSSASAQTAVQTAGQSGQVDCETAESQADLNTCAKLDFDEADAGLNNSYKAAVAKLHDLDKVLAPADQGGEAALRDAQRTWITFRDQACAAEGWTVHGGTMEPMVVLECKARVTTSRSDDLWAISESGDQ